MTKTTEKTSVVIEERVASLDGAIEVRVTKLWTNLNVKAQRHEIQTGVTVEPMDILVVDIPVEGVKAGEPVSPENAAAVLEETLRMVIPTLEIFVGEANRDFTEPEESF